MSLHDPPLPEIDLSPRVGTLLDWQKPEDYLRLAGWLLWFPQRVDHYIETVIDQPDQIEDAKPADNLPTWLQHWSSLPLFNSLIFQTLTLGVIALFFINSSWWLVSRLYQDNPPTVGLLLLAYFVGLSVILAPLAVLIVSEQVLYADAAIHAIHYILWTITLGIVASLIILNLALHSGLPHAAFLGFEVGLFLVIIQTVVTPRMSSKILSIVKELTVMGAGMLLLLLVITIRFPLVSVQQFSATDTIPLWLGLGTYLLVYSFVGLRLDDWLFAWYWCEDEPDANGDWHIPRVTPLTFWRVREQLEEWLEEDWDKGIYNANQIMQYSLQSRCIFGAISRAYQEASEEPDGEIMEKAATLAAHGDSWDFLRFGVYPQRIPRRSSPKSSKKMAFGRRRRRSRRKSNIAIKRNELSLDPPLITPGQAALAGFWYLEQKYPEYAADAFANVSVSNNGKNPYAKDNYSKEMLSLCNVLKELIREKDLAARAPLKIPNRPRQAKHKEAWDALEQLCQTVRYVWIMRRCQSHAYWRMSLRQARQRLNTILQNQDLHRAERPLFYAIAGHWLESLDEMGEIVLESPELKPLDNLYIFAEPLYESSTFVGRTSQIAQLKRAWIVGNFQPVLLYGQRQIGKTSILLNVHKSVRNIDIVDVHFGHLDQNVEPVQLLLSICDKIEYGTMAYPVSQNALQQNPNYVFQQYVRRVCDELHPRGLVIALDDYEHLSNDESGGSMDRLMVFLWRLAQTVSNLSFVFITSQTPEEIRGQYANHFISGTAHVHVSYLSYQEVQQLLCHPSPEFLPHYTEDTVEMVMALTAGQPYLVQLIAYHLVQHYNDTISKGRDPLFTVEDVQAVLQYKIFQNHAQRYYENILVEARETDPKCESILCQIAKTETGLSELDAQDSDFELPLLQSLEEHDILYRPEPSCWQIRVELLRQWLK